VTVRRVLYALAVAFTAYFLLRGVLWALEVPHTWLQLVAVVLWLAAVAAAVLTPGRAVGPGEDEHSVPTRLPLPAVIAIVTIASTIAPLSLIASGDQALDPLASGMYGAVGEVLTIVCVRRRGMWAWIGVTVLAIEGSIAMGVDLALQRGLLGTILWVGLAQLLLWLTDRAYRDTARLARLQQASSAWQAAQEARRFERRQRVQFALLVAGPVLTRVIETGGALTSQERLRALLAEGTLRDELRAPRLLDDEVRLAIRAVRERGATVTLLDENGLPDVDDADLARIRSDLAETLRATTADRIIVRTSADPDVALTVVGRAASGDPDDVELWREVPRRSTRV